MKCKICEKEFELKKEEKYLATEKVAAFGTLAKLPKTFEASQICQRTSEVDK